MSILCLDIATTTGWALWNDPQVLSGFVCFKSEETNGHRLLNFWRALNEWHRLYDITHIFYELPGSFQGRGHANKVVPHLIGVLELWAALHEVPIEWVSPSTLKKFATGRGQKVSKKEMLDAASKLWQKAITDHNEADALLILKYFMVQYDYQSTRQSPDAAQAV